MSNDTFYYFLQEWWIGYTDDSIDDDTCKSTGYWKIFDLIVLGMVVKTIYNSVILYN